MAFLQRAGKALAPVFCLIGVLALTHSLWFRWLGEYLVDTDELVKADAILVLAGDWTGDRIERAGRLAQEGFAPIVFVSGPMNLYGVNEAALAIDYAVGRGYARDLFVPMVSGALSTRDEAGFFLPEFRKRGVHRLLVVTTDFHTHRAGRLFRKGLMPDLEIRMIGAPDRHFSANGWWKDREGQKTLFLEWSKTIASLMDI